MKYVKIHPRVALQMQSNLYTYRTSFAKCIYIFRFKVSLPYLKKISYSFYIIKSFPYIINIFLYVIYRFSFNHVPIFIKYETIYQLLKMLPCGVCNPILYIMGQNDPFPHQQLFSLEQYYCGETVTIIAVMIIQDGGRPRR